MGKCQSYCCLPKSDQPKTVNIFLGFFFIVNFCLGTGFLGVPYSFYYSGYLAGIPTLLLIAFISWVNAIYVIECMARAQAIESHKKSICPPTDQDSDMEDKAGLINATTEHHPQFEVTIYRKFETVEMFEIFFHKAFKYIYLVIFTIYNFLAMWSFSTVAGSAWAANLPFPKNSTVPQCEEDAFQHDLIPEGDCRNTYYLCLSIFAVLVVLLSLLDLKEQAWVQLFLGVLRFITVGAIIVYSIARMAESGDKCLVDQASSLNYTPEYFINESLTPSTDSIVLRFNVNGWLAAIPVFAYAFILHQGLPSLTHPIKQKRYLHWLVVAMFVVALICYGSLGIIVPLWFKADIQETCTLNFVELTTKSSSSTALVALSYYIVLFPSVDVVSAYPLVVHTVVNNIYIILTGRDTSKKPSEKIAKFNWLILLSLKLFAAIVPILTAFGISNLIYVLKYAGLLGFSICFFFPTSLQLRSIYVCKNYFSNKNYYNVSGTGNPDQSDFETKGGINAPSSTEKKPLLSVQKLQGKEGRQLYMTPYSFLCLSHPIAVVIVGIIGVVLFWLTFGSLFVHPETEVCLTGEENGRLLDEL